VRATLNDGVGTYNQDLTFKVTFGPDCSKDTLKFTQPIPSLVEYFISIPPKPEQYRPVVKQTVANCPYSCKMTEGNWDAAISFNEATGTITVIEVDYFMRDYEEVDVAIQCTSTLSKSAGAKATNAFVIRYLDACRGATMVFPDIYPDSYETTLWPVPADQYPFDHVQTDIFCGPYDYAIIADPIIIDGLSIKESGQLSIVAQMTSREQVGIWEVQVEVYDLGFFVGEVSNIITLEVKDPCVVTTISSTPIDRKLVAAVGIPDTYRVAGWPFVDSVDAALNP